MSQIRISRDALNEVQRALHQYGEVLAELEQTKIIEKNTEKTYYRYAEMFTRWLRGEFDPGGRNKP